MRKICLLLSFIFSFICAAPTLSYAAEVVGNAQVGAVLEVADAESIDYPEFSIGRIEAEEMYTRGYYKVNNANASGGKYIKIYGDQSERGGVWALAAFKYTGSRAAADINVVYPDFYSGASPKYLYLNGQKLAMWSGKITYGTSVWGTVPPYTKDSLKTKTVKGVVLKEGDIITFVSKPDYGEYGELDYIELTAGGTGEETDDGFIDISADENKDKINALLGYGIISMSDNKMFNPASPLKIDEFSKMLLEMLGYKNIGVAAEYWADNYIKKLISYGALSENEDYTSVISAAKAESIINSFDYINYSKDLGSGNLTRSMGAALIYDLREYLESQKALHNDTEEALFPLDSNGYIKTWLYTGGVLQKTLEGHADPAVVMPEISGYPLDVVVPDNSSFSLTLENGMDFNVLPMGSSGFITDLLRGGDPQLGFLLSYACCDIISEQDCTINAKIVGTRGNYDIFLNGEKVSDLYWFWTRTTDKSFTLSLKKGVNRLFIRLQNVGANILTTNYGIQLLNNTDKIKTTVPAQKDILSSVNLVEEWTYGVTLDENGNLKASAPPREGAVILAGNKSYDWPLYDDTFNFEKEYGSSDLRSFTLKSKIGENYVERKIELPQKYNPERTAFETLETHQKNYREQLIKAEKMDWDWSEYVVLRLNEGYELSDKDIERIRSTINKINPLNDCAEFAMVHLLRLFLLYGDMLPQDLTAEIKDCILNFAYFSDEEGSNAMVVSSENHKIGFYTCQYIAGSLYPKEIFKRSGRTGAEQMAVAESRLNSWFDNVEQEGFEEFNSPDYIDITMNALLNCYDFVDNSSLKARAKTALDLQLRTMAATAFDGVSAGVNGRVYANALMYPSQSEKSKLLSYLSPSMNFPDYTQQILGLATTSYQPPSDLEELITKDIELTYNQGGTRLNIKKTADYIISSATIPTPATGTLAANFQKGMLLYQPHLWEASVGAMAKAFVTHPGSTSENASTRPAYWYGEYYSPVIRQNGSEVYEIYNIPSTNGIQFTHAYFTKDTFDETVIEEQWLFGRKGSGYIALWCSSPLTANSDLTINTEYRADSLKTGWICIASSESENGSFMEFVNKCKARNPSFNDSKLKLSIDGNEVLAW